MRSTVFREVECVLNNNCKRLDDISTIFNKRFITLSVMFFAAFYQILTGLSMIRAPFRKFFFPRRGVLLRSQLRTHVANYILIDWQH